MFIIIIITIIIIIIVIIIIQSNVLRSFCHIKNISTDGTERKY